MMRLVRAVETAKMLSAEDVPPSFLGVQPEEEAIRGKYHALQSIRV